MRVVRWIDRGSSRKFALRRHLAHRGVNAVAITARRRGRASALRRRPLPRRHAGWHAAVRGTARDRSRGASGAASTQTQCRRRRAFKPRNCSHQPARRISIARPIATGSHPASERANQRPSSQRSALTPPNPGSGRSRAPPAASEAATATSSPARPGAPQPPQSSTAAVAAAPQAARYSSRRGDGATSSSRLADPRDDRGEAGVGTGFTRQQVRRELRVLQAEQADEGVAFDA